MNDPSDYLGAKPLCRGLIARVAASAGVDADSAVDIGEPRILRSIIDGIICVECAGMPYDGSEIDDGLKLAGIT